MVLLVCMATIHIASRLLIDSHATNTINFWLKLIFAFKVFRFDVILFGHWPSDPNQNQIILIYTPNEPNQSTECKSPVWLSFRCYCTQFCDIHRLWLQNLNYGDNLHLDSAHAPFCNCFLVIRPSSLRVFHILNNNTSMMPYLATFSVLYATNVPYAKLWELKIAL